MGMEGEKVVCDINIMGRQAEWGARERERRGERERSEKRNGGASLRYNYYYIGDKISNKS